MQKYQQYYQEMVSQNEKLFRNFKEIHDKYLANQDANRKEFNEIGSEVMDIIRNWEGRLCGKTEGSGFGKFSSNLADKFWQEIREHFQLIDMVGIS